MTTRHTLIFSMALAASLPLMGCQKKSPEPMAKQEAETVTLPPYYPAPVEEAPVVVTYTWEQTRDEVAKNLQRVQFPFDSSELTTMTKATLLRTADILSEHPEITVIIEGHADDRGSDRYNLVLGEERAKAVATYLTNHGADPDQVMAVSLGEADPLVEGDSKRAYSYNRRAEFVVVSDPDAVVDASTDDPVGGAGLFDDQEQ